MYDPDFKRVSTIELNTNGWEMTPNNKTVLFFDKILLNIISIRKKKI